MIGRVLSHFEISAKLGEGGMGAVYRARDRRLGREVAIKVLPPELTEDRQRLERFRREARILAALNHPGVGAIYDEGEADGLHFLVLELVAGETLERRIPTHGMAPSELVDIASALCEAVAVAHEAGITHRDLKPANVMITDSGGVKVLDFGLARVAPRQADPLSEAPTRSGSPLTRRGAGMGTLPYMSPEQVRGEPVGPTSDVFSLGTVLYEMAAGERPFGGGSSAELASAILRDQPMALTRRRPDLPRAFCEAVMRCLEKQAAGRYASARELADALASGKETTAQSGESIESIAVLPLADLSVDAPEPYFSEGMVEALITDLAKVGGFRVISRSSSARYAETDKSERQIGRELGVDALLLGSILRVGERVRISVRLVRAADESLLWAERYDRHLEDVLALQAEVAGAIANAVGRTLGAAAVATGRRRKVDPEVYLLDLRGRHHLVRRTEEAFRSGLRCFQRAIDRDPTYAPAWTGLADSYEMLANYGHIPPSEIRPLASAAADKALELDPNSATICHWFGAYLTVIGYHERGQGLLDRAISLDPLSLLFPSLKGWGRYFERRYEEALPFYRRVLQLDPDYFVAHWFRGETLVELERFEEGIHSLERALELSGRISRLLGYLGYAYGRAGRRSDAERMLAELEERGAKGYVPPYFPALVWAGLDEDDRALDCLERAWEVRDTMLRDLRADSQWDRLHANPRFEKIMAKLAFPNPP